MLTLITLPENFITQITTTMGDLFTDLSAYLTLVIGILLGALVITILIGAIKN